MSFIRALSSPERLYVYEGSDGVHFYWNLGSPLTNGSEMVVPSGSFYRVVNEWVVTQGLFGKVMHESGEVVPKALVGFAQRDEFLIARGGRHRR